MATRPTDPVRQRFVEARRALLRLHKALVDSERAAYEAREGAVSSGVFLQLLLQDPFFAWLRPYSGLLAAMDGALAADDGLDPSAARGYLAELRALVSDEGEPGAETRYAEVRRRDPNVLYAHAELFRRLREAEDGGEA